MKAQLRGGVFRECGFDNACCRSQMRSMNDLSQTLNTVYGKRLYRSQPIFARAAGWPRGTSRGASLFPEVGPDGAHAR